MNFRKLNLLKNFNHVIKEILEKDLDLSGNIETVNILKNEFLGDLPVTNNVKIQTTEDKENINTANIQNNVVVKPSNDLNINAPIQTRKNNPTYRKTSYKDRTYNPNSYQQQPYNSFYNKSNDHSRRNPRVFRQESLKTQNFYYNNSNKFSSSYQNNPDANQTSFTENKGTNKNSNYYNNVYSIYEESIYVPNAGKEKFNQTKANM